MMKQVRCTWGKHDAQGASTGTRNQASWVVGTNCIAGESSKERAPPPEGRTQKEKKSHRDELASHELVGVMLTDPFGDGCGNEVEKSMSVVSREQNQTENRRWRNCLFLFFDWRASGRGACHARRQNGAHR
jgi:hypothetical protein